MPTSSRRNALLAAADTVDNAAAFWVAVTIGLGLVNVWAFRHVGILAWLVIAGVVAAIAWFGFAIATLLASAARLYVERSDPSN